MVWLRRLLAAIGILLAALLALAAYGYSEAARDPVVVRYRIALADWPAGTPPLTIAQLSDIHVAWPDMPIERLARIVAQVNALQPDLVALTGDYSGGKLYDLHVARYEKIIAPLEKLRARYGVVAVRGNHDEAFWTPIVFGKTSIAMLQNRWIEAGPVIVAGIDDITAGTNPVVNARRAGAGAPAGRPLVVLAHEPDFFQWLPARADLLLSGHTHGGQIKLPLLGTRELGVPFEDAHLRGHFFERGRHLIVSSGIGTSVVPLRIGVPPEIALITLGPADHSVGRNSGTDR